MLEAPTQNVEESNTIEDVAHPCRRMHDPQHAVCRDDHVVGADQIPYARRVDSGHQVQVEDDDSRAPVEMCAHLLLEFSVDRRLKSAPEIEHTSAVPAGPLDHGHQPVRLSARWIENAELVSATHSKLTF